MTTVTDVLNEFRAELVAGGRSPGTIALRMSHARRCLAEVGKPIDHITRGDLVTWLAGHQWGPSARASARASIRVLFKWAYAAGIAPVDVSTDLPTVIQPRAVPRPTPDLIVMGAMRSAPPLVAVAIELMATTGVRRSECARIKSGDVEPHGQGHALRVVGKGGHVRLIPLAPHLAARIQAAGGWLFPGGDHGHISPGWLGKLISRALPETWTGHKLRHRYGSTAYAHGHDIRAVQELLGHASIETTRGYVAVDGASVAASAAATWRIAA